MPHRRRFHVEGATHWRQLGLRADRRALVVQRIKV
jgi:hypothetical protein